MRNNKFLILPDEANWPVCFSMFGVTRIYSTSKGGWDSTQLNSTKLHVDKNSSSEIGGLQRIGYLRVTNIRSGNQRVFWNFKTQIDSFSLDISLALRSITRNRGSYTNNLHTTFAIFCLTHFVDGIKFAAPYLHTSKAYVREAFDFLCNILQRSGARVASSLCSAKVLRSYRE